MTGDDVRRFVNRDWARVAAAKATAWIERKGTPADDLRMANELRRHTIKVRPDWPSADDRADDLRTHLRLHEALSAVDVRPR